MDVKKEPKTTPSQAALAEAIAHLARRAFLDGWTAGRRAKREVRLSDWDAWVEKNGEPSEGAGEGLFGRYWREAQERLGIQHEEPELGSASRRTSDG
jgi:hypothetical protein